MPATEQDLYARLDALGLDWTTTEHPPLHTVAESKALRGELEGGHVKNLFLRDKNKEALADRGGGGPAGRSQILPQTHRRPRARCPSATRTC